MHDEKPGCLESLGQEPCSVDQIARREVDPVTVHERYGLSHLYLDSVTVDMKHVNGRTVDSCRHGYR